MERIEDRHRWFFPFFILALLWILVEVTFGALLVAAPHLYIFCTIAYFSVGLSKKRFGLPYSILILACFFSPAVHILSTSVESSLAEYIFFSALFLICSSPIWFLRSEVWLLLASMVCAVPPAFIVPIYLGLGML